MYIYKHVWPERWSDLAKRNHKQTIPTNVKQVTIELFQPKQFHQPIHAYLNNVVFVLEQINDCEQTNNKKPRGRTTQT